LSSPCDGKDPETRRYSSCVVLHVRDRAKLQLLFFSVSFLLLVPNFHNQWQHRAPNKAHITISFSFLARIPLIIEDSCSTGRNTGCWVRRPARVLQSHAIHYCNLFFSTCKASGATASVSSPLMAESCLIVDEASIFPSAMAWQRDSMPCLLRISKP